MELTKVEMAFILSSQHRMLEEILAMMRELAGTLRTTAGLETEKELRLMEVEGRIEEMDLELKGSLEKKHEALDEV